MPEMKRPLLIAALATATLLSGCEANGGMGMGYASQPQGGGYYNRQYQRQYGRYDYNRPDPAYNGYEADRYYREDSRYQERRLNNEDRVYRGKDDRYYCRRSDGTTGLIIGGLGGAAVGSLIAPGDSRGLGAILGAIGGAAIGGTIDANNVRCR